MKKTLFWTVASCGIVLALAVAAGAAPLMPQSSLNSLLLSNTSPGVANQLASASMTSDPNLIAPLALSSITTPNPDQVPSANEMPRPAVTVATIPEPSGLLPVGLGLLVAAGMARRRR